METGGNNLECLVYWEGAEKEDVVVAVAAERWWGSRAERWTSFVDKPIEQQVGRLLDQRRVVAAAEEDRAVVIVVDFGKKSDKRELQQ